MRILVIKPSSLGDIFHVFPALNFLRRVWPEAEFDFLVNPLYSGVLDFSPVPISRKILFERKKLGRLLTFLPAFLRLWRDIRSEKYDLVIDFQGLFRSAFCAFLARGGVRCGFAEPREAAAARFYDRRYEVPSGLHAVKRCLALAEAVAGEKHTDADLELTLPSSERAAVRAEILLEKKHLDRGFRLIGVIPGARWSSKRFPPEFFAAVITHCVMQRPDWRFVLLGGNADVPVCRRIVSLVPEGAAASLAGKTDFPAMIELLRRCDAVMTNDSGPSHAAAALGKTIFAFFGPTDPERTGPFGKEVSVFQNDSLDCVKCLKRKCGNRLCQNLDPVAVAGKILEKMPC